MNSKEVQLSLAFCGALAAIILISSPLNETVALAGSGAAFIIACGFFYSGLSKYFADKEKQTQITEEQTRFLVENFEKKLLQSQNSANAQLLTATKNFNDTLSNSFQKPISELQNSINAQLQDVIEVIENLERKLLQSQNFANAQLQTATKNFNDTLNNSFKKPISELQNSINAQIKEIIEAVENLDDSLNDSIGVTLNEISDNVSNVADNVKHIKTETENIGNNSSKIKEINKTSAELLENVEDLSKSITEVSKINETLQNLLRTINHQEEFYQTMLSQYKNMTTKDVELIENLARKLR